MLYKGHRHLMKGTEYTGELSKYTLKEASMLQQDFVYSQVRIHREIGFVVDKG